jgi:hypothetical protein
MVTLRIFLTVIYALIFALNLGRLIFDKNCDREAQVSAAFGWLCAAIVSLQLLNSL